MLLPDHSYFLAAKAPNLEVLRAEAAAGGHLVGETAVEASSLRVVTLGGGTSVTVSEWAPQNDILADGRVSLFITHGGLNSALEGERLHCVAGVEG